MTKFLEKNIEMRLASMGSFTGRATKTDHRAPWKTGSTGNHKIAFHTEMGIRKQLYMFFYSRPPSATEEMLSTRFRLILTPLSLCDIATMNLPA